ncbi:DUF998 domain-containing protein [Kutzneria sp. NPDC052558]|uniref:DUF998 domain-containing protein n=1 Tax=Kutzneria sp. NPDC052558 TaxID=3364121 RepID=UPI0037C56AA7
MTTTPANAVKAGGVALAVAALWYLIAEAITASAWKNPPYSYSRNAISDLGVPSCGGELQGRVICSPLHGVMNSAFILQGVLFVVAAVLLFRLLLGRMRWVYLFLALVQGVGIVVVGLIHGSPESLANGMMVWHGLGAFMAILGGNLVFVVIGGHILRRRTETWLGITEVALGVIGLVAAVVLAMNWDAPYAAVYERISVYPIIVAQLIAGIVLIGWRRTAPAAAHAQPLPTGAPE